MADFKNYFRVDPNVGFGDYNTINAAIAAAVAGGVSATNRYVIEVARGIFVENVDVPAGVLLKGQASFGGTRIDGYVDLHANGHLKDLYIYPGTTPTAAPYSLRWLCDATGATSNCHNVSITQSSTAANSTCCVQIEGTGTSSLLKVIGGAEHYANLRYAGANPGGAIRNIGYWVKSDFNSYVEVFATHHRGSTGTTGTATPTLVFNETVAPSSGLGYVHLTFCDWLEVYGGTVYGVAPAPVLLKSTSTVNPGGIFDVGFKSGNGGPLPTIEMAYTGNRYGPLYGRVSNRIRLVGGDVTKLHSGVDFAINPDVEALAPPTLLDTAPEGTTWYDVSTSLYDDENPTTFDVRAYGAALDGTTNDSAAWQAAIDAASLAGGGIVSWTKGGTLSLAKNLRLPDGVGILLWPNNTLRLHDSAVTGDFLVGNLDFVGGNNTIGVRGGTYDGNTAAFSLGENITTFQFQKVAGLHMSDLTVTGGPAEGAYMYQCTNVLLEGVRAHLCGITSGTDHDGSGVHLEECEGVRLDSLRCSENRFYGLFLNGSTRVSGDVTALQNNLDGIRVNACWGIALNFSAIGNGQRGLYTHLNTYGSTFNGNALENGWHGVVANETYSCQFSGLCLDTLITTNADLYFTASTDSLTFHGRAGLVVNEGPATNSIVSGPLSSASIPDITEKIQDVLGTTVATTAPLSGTYNDTAGTLTLTLAPSAFRANYTSNLAVTAAAAAVAVPFTAESLDTLSEYNTTTSAFTALAAGTYLFDVALYWNDTNTGGRRVYLYVNGTESRNGNVTKSNTQPVTTSATWMVTLAAGDVVTVRAFSETTGNVNGGSSRTWFAGVRLF